MSNSSSTFLIVHEKFRPFHSLPLGNLFVTIKLLFQQQGSNSGKNHLQMEKIFIKDENDWCWKEEEKKMSLHFHLTRINDSRLIMEQSHQRSY